MNLVTLHTLRTYYTHTLSFFYFLSLSGYTGKVDNNSTIDSQLAHTISHSFIFLHWKADITHTDSIGYIIYTHTNVRATCLPYHMIDLPFIFFSFCSPLPPNYM